MTIASRARYLLKGAGRVSLFIIRISAKQNEIRIKVRMEPVSVKDFTSLHGFKEHYRNVRCLLVEILFDSMIE
jgi:hypothetical protein